MLSAGVDGEKLGFAGTSQSPTPGLLVENELGVVLAIQPDLQTGRRAHLSGRQSSIDVSLDHLIWLTKRDVHHSPIRKPTRNVIHSELPIGDLDATEIR